MYKNQQSISSVFNFPDYWHEKPAHNPTLQGPLP